MKASTFYRIAAVLLLLFAVGHTLGFRQSDPKWGIDSLLASMHSIHFDALGFNRTYWDFFVGAGLQVTVLLLFATVLAWQLGRLPANTLALLRVTAWTFALCFAAVTFVSWRYLFTIPIVFSLLITLCLTAAAWLSTKNDTAIVNRMEGPKSGTSGLATSDAARDVNTAKLHDPT